MVSHLGKPETALDRYLERLPKEQQATAIAWAETDDEVFKAQVGMAIQEINTKLDRSPIRAQLLVLGGAVGTSGAVTIFGHNITDLLARIGTGLLALL